MAKVGFRITKWRGKELIQHVEAEERKRLEKAAIHLKNEIKKNISIKGVQCNKGEDTGTRSAPDEFPHLECGELRRSMAHELDSRKLIARVGSNKPYAKYLELGTARMAKRPFLRPTLAEQKKRIAEIMLKKIPGM